MLTVMLATRNRAPILEKVLQAYCVLEAPASGWKLVVVDNGSTDGTARVIDAFVSRLPLHRVFEPEPGKNRALNAGLALAEGDLIVFTDDDVFPQPDWLAAMRRSADSQPSYAMFAGAILPRWESPPPHWVHWIDLRPVFTLTDPALVEGPVSAGLVFGPNMAIRTALFRTGLRFDTSIGPRGASYPMGSETELVQRLARQGQRAWYSPQAVVEHLVRKAQLEQGWVMDRAVRYGRGKFRLAQTGTAPAGQASLALRWRASRRLLKEGLVMTASRLARRQRALLRARWRFNYWRGQLIEARLFAAERREAGAPPSGAEARPQA